MAVVSYEHGEYYALAGVKAQVGGLALIKSTGVELATANASSTTYTQGDLGLQGSDVLTLTSSVQFTIGAGAVGSTAAKLRIKTGVGGTNNMFDIDLTATQTFSAEGVYTLTASTLGIA